MNWSKNLTETSVQPGKPWEFTDTSRIPEAVRTNKKARDAWICAAETEHHVYSLFEGINSAMRLNGDADGNPPAKLHGLVADFDVPLTAEDVKRAFERFGLKPNWYETTLSGHARILWLFEQPLAVPPSMKQVGRLLEYILKEGHFDSFLPALDRGAFIDPGRRFTNSGAWTKLSDDLLPDALVRGWFVEFAPKMQWDAPELGTAMPMDVVREKLAEKYPRFGEWPDEFAVGAQGPSFWVDGSDSPKSALVRESGIHTFADHAAKPFYSWADLLGVDFVKQYETVERGRAVDGIYFDGKSYWVTDAGGIWRAKNKGDISDYLKIVRKITDRRNRQTGVSPLEEALSFIHETQHVDGAAPVVFRQPGGVAAVGQKRYLNISRAKVMQPAEQATATWGPDGDFPFISRLLDEMFGPEQLPWLIAEFQYRYAAALRFAPAPAHNIFLVGPTDIGKSLLNREIFGVCMGGFVDAGKYLTGQDNFGSEIFDVGWLAVDDGVSVSSAKFHRHFSEMVKSMNANRHFRYHAKFQTPSMIEWIGTIFCTLNDDPESKQQLPALGISNLDKICLFRAHKISFKFPTNAKVQEILTRERPLFLRWLLNWTRPDYIVENARYGLRDAYHEPSLLDAANQATDASSFREIVEDWRTHYFTANPTAIFWEGTALQLFKELTADPAVESAMRPYPVKEIGRNLATLRAQGFPAEPGTKAGMRTWKIGRPEGLEAVKASTAVPPQSSKFDATK